MKKKTTKPTASPAPATKIIAVKPLAKKKSVAPARPKTAAVVPAPAVPDPKPVVVAPAPAPAPAVAKPAPVKPVPPAPVVTSITARIDIGFGNTLFIRGEGDGLSWNAGAPMQCVGADEWSITLGRSPGGYLFKFLVNDLTWNVGPDYHVESGATVTLSPEF